MNLKLAVFFALRYTILFSGDLNHLLFESVLVLNLTEYGALYFFLYRPEKYYAHYEVDLPPDKRYFHAQQKKRRYLVFLMQAFTYSMIKAYMPNRCVANS